MIDYNGFAPGATSWRFSYERQKTGNDTVEWLADKSGNFISSSRKVGVIRLWNVAHKEASRVVKVGNYGIHTFKRL